MKERTSDFRKSVRLARQRYNLSRIAGTLRLDEAIPRTKPVRLARQVE